MLKKHAYILFTILVLTALAVIPASAGISGTGVSGIQIQNLDVSAPALVSVELWNQTGATPVAISAASGDTIPQGAAKNYYLPDPSLNVPGGNYAMVVSATKPIGAIARTDWSATGGAALYSNVEPATDVILPLVTKNFAGQTTQFTIQNTDIANPATDVDIVLLGRGLSTPVRTLDNETIPAGTSKTYNLADASWGSLPNTGTDMGSSGFVGSVRVTSSKPLVVQSFIDIAGTRGVTGFSGVPTTAADTTLYCPLIRANYFGDTGISIVNPNSNPITVNIQFTADAGSPKKGVFSQPINVAGNSSQVAFQGPNGNSRQAPTNLPGGTQSAANPTPTNNGFYGVAKLTSSDGPFLAVVNDTLFGAGWSVQSQSTYNCATANEAGTTFALPLVRRYHLASTKLTTGIQIQNTGTSAVTVALELYNWNGTRQASSDPAPIVIPAGGSGNFWNGNLTGLPTVPASAGGFGWYGSAVLKVIEGTSKVVVVVSDEGFGSTKVDSANYNALQMASP